MDTKTAGKKGGLAAWAGLNRKERSLIISERNRRRWAKWHADQKRKNAVTNGKKENERQ